MPQTSETRWGSVPSGGILGHRNWVAGWCHLYGEAECHGRRE